MSVCSCRHAPPLSLTIHARWFKGFSTRSCAARWIGRWSSILIAQLCVTVGGEHLGFTPDQVLGHSGWEFVHPDDQPRVQAEFDPVVEGGGGAGTLLFRVIDAWETGYG